MIRTHLEHVDPAIDDRSLPIRAAITLVALASLPLFGSGVRTLDTWLGRGQLLLPMLVVAYVSAAIELVAVRSIDGDVCRSEGPA